MCCVRRDFVAFHLCEDKLTTLLQTASMTTYNQTSSYNRTYEKKVIEETPRIRIGTIPQASPFTTTHIIPEKSIQVRRWIKKCTIGPKHFGLWLRSRFWNGYLPLTFHANIDWRTVGKMDKWRMEWFQ
ncbi:hypothetical protein ANCCEY_07364 [Ancylostoma ceylanicum]|uniref:Uncharacterized protein n=1 Tax=Ancylostoma ceylanicum TaxID=53326 RepID=A0A0D6LQR4_9BILA|nr:hypothetical protein ANCCEY_07364 [Ancylostoma ceylanicum]